MIQLSQDAGIVIFLPSAPSAHGIDPDVTVPGAINEDTLVVALAVVIENPLAIYDGNAT